jgi:hypothetical protein
MGSPLPAVGGLQSAGRLAANSRCAYYNGVVVGCWVFGVRCWVLDGTARSFGARCPGITYNKTQEMRNVQCKSTQTQTQTRLSAIRVAICPGPGSLSLLPLALASRHSPLARPACWCLCLLVRQPSAGWQYYVSLMACGLANRQRPKAQRKACVGRQQKPCV